MKKIALYDIDYTIISVNSLLWFYYYIFIKKPLKILYLPYLVFTISLWAAGLIRTKKVKELWLNPLKSFTKDGIEAISKEFVERLLIKKIKPGAIANINEFRKKGYTIILASASYELYIDYLAKYLKADHCFGTRMTYKDNRPSAEIPGENCRGEEKIRRITDVIKEKDISRKESVSYSDSISDKPFLKLTAEFNLVNRRKWKIIRTLT